MRCLCGYRFGLALLLPLQIRLSFSCLIQQRLCASPGGGEGGKNFAHSTCAFAKSFQRVGFALVKLPNGGAIESVLVDLKVGAEKQLWREFLHGKSYGFRGRLESLVADRTVAEASAPRWKEFCLGLVVDGSHGLASCLRLELLSRDVWTRKLTVSLDVCRASKLRR